MMAIADGVPLVCPGEKPHVWHHMPYELPGSFWIPLSPSAQGSWQSRNQEYRGRRSLERASLGLWGTPTPLPDLRVAVKSPPHSEMGQQAPTQGQGENPKRQSRKS